MSAGTAYLFVYGTLQRGCGNHGQLSGAVFAGPARTKPSYRLYALDGYPGMVRDEGTAAIGIPGELWEVDRESLERLDRFEGVDEGLYRRVRVELEAPHDGRFVQTYLYAAALTGQPELVRWEAAGGVPR